MTGTPGRRTGRRGLGGRMTPRTLFDKIWDAHVVAEAPGEPSLIYVDLHLVHEVTSPQAFESLRIEGRSSAQAGHELLPRWTTTSRPTAMGSAAPTR